MDNRPDKIRLEKGGCGGYTGEDCYLIYIAEISVAFALEACPKVCNEDLGSLVKSYCLAVETGFVLEALEVLC